MFAVFTINAATAQWLPQNSNTTNHLTSICFTDNDTGFTVGEAGTILKSIDGGENWSIINSGISAELNSVFFINQNIGYVVGNYGTILKTTDAGENWTTFITGTTSNLLAVHFPTEDIGYVVGGDVIEPGLILKTTDGGESWASSTWEVNTKLMAVYFMNNDTGFAVGQKVFMSFRGIIIKTLNGGANWELVFSCGPDYGSLSSICFTDQNNGFVSGQKNYTGYLVKTTNGGTTWTGNYVNIAQGLNFSHFPNSNIGYAVGNDSNMNRIILKTTNGGNDWSLQYTGGPYGLGLSCVNFLNENNGFVVGSKGLILKTTSGGTTGINESEAVQNSITIFPNPIKDRITLLSTLVTNNTQFSVFNVSGEKLLERQLTNTEIQIDISALPQGVYFVRLQNEKMVEVGKMVKE